MSTPGLSWMEIESRLRFVKFEFTDGSLCQSFPGIRHHHEIQYSVFNRMKMRPTKQFWEEFCSKMRLINVQHHPQVLILPQRMIFTRIVYVQYLRSFDCQQKVSFTLTDCNALPLLCLFSMLFEFVHELVLFYHRRQRRRRPRPDKSCEYICVQSLRYRYRHFEEYRYTVETMPQWIDAKLSSCLIEIISKVDEYVCRRRGMSANMHWIAFRINEFFVFALKKIAKTKT